MENWGMNIRFRQKSNFFKFKILYCIMKILIIEDEADISAGIKNYFKPNDLQCEIETTDKEAFFRISNYDYDCILLDLMLFILRLIETNTIIYKGSACAVSNKDRQLVTA